MTRGPHLGTRGAGILAGEASVSEQEESRAMKVRKSLRSLKSMPGAQVVRRRGTVFVINKKNPRFKARQG